MLTNNLQQHSREV